MTEINHDEIELLIKERMVDALYADRIKGLDIINVFNSYLDLKAKYDGLKATVKWKEGDEELYQLIKEGK